MLSQAAKQSNGLRRTPLPTSRQVPAMALGNSELPVGTFRVQMVGGHFAGQEICSGREVLGGEWSRNSFKGLLCQGHAFHHRAPHSEMCSTVSAPPEKAKGRRPESACSEPTTATTPGAESRSPEQHNSVMNNKEKGCSAPQASQDEQKQPRTRSSPLEHKLQQAPRLTLIVRLDDVS